MADFQRLLTHSSRTFALAIPLLPEPTRHAVTLAYLLFRIADTFEDAARWPREDRLAALAAFDGLVRAPDPARAAALADAWARARPCDHEGYLELLAEAPAVLDAFHALAPGARAIVGRHTLRTAEGMAGFVRRSTEAGELHLADLEDLRHYCYIVAGIVGEMLTDLFLDGDAALAPAASVLAANARAFGEGLQLVNILKDAADDARDGRTYLPPGVTRASVFALARADLDAARTYVLALQSHGAHRGVVAFTGMPVLLARATLDRVEALGPGAKVSRAEVAALGAALDAALDAGTPAV